MTKLSDRPHTALIVIDVQNGVVADVHQRDAVVANIATLVDKARGEGVPIVWVQHSAPGRTAAVEETKDVTFAG